MASALTALPPGPFDFVALGRPELDITDPASVAAALDLTSPVAMVNAAAYTAVDRAESEADLAFRVNAHGPGLLAAEAGRRSIPLVHLSTDYVFSGEKREPYVETDATAPLGVYGASKLAGEIAVASAAPRHVTLRTAWVHGPVGANFVRTMLRLAGERDRIRVVGDQWGTPTHSQDIATAVAAVLRTLLAAPDDPALCGVFHLTSAGETSWAGFAAEIFRVSPPLGGPFATVEAITTAEYPTAAKRPANSRLSSERFRQAFGLELPPWEDGVRRSVAAMIEVARPIGTSG